MIESIEAVNTQQDAEVPMDENVIEFPTREPEDGGSPRLPNTLEEIRANVEAIRHIHIDEVTEAIVSTACRMAGGAGFDLLEEDLQTKKDFAFIIEATRSALCRTVGIYHPFQDVADNILNEVPNSPALQIADSINVKFHNETGDDGTEAETSP